MVIWQEINICNQNWGKIGCYFRYTFLYGGVFFIGLGVEAPIGVVLMAILVQHFYGMIATYYIVPKIRKLEVFKHTRLKNFL